MRIYKVTLEVDYVIKASSLDEAIRLAEEDSEHPLVGGMEVGYCDDVRPVGGAIMKETE